MDWTERARQEEEDRQMALALQMSLNPEFHRDCSPPPMASTSSSFSSSSSSPLTTNNNHVNTKASSPTIDEQLEERKQAHLSGKRKAESEDEEQQGGRKRIASQAVGEASASFGLSGGSTVSRLNVHCGKIRFLRGALRISPTPGRQNNPNAIHYHEIFERDYILKAFISTFFLAEKEFLSCLPLGKNAKRDAPIYMGRDVSQDPSNRWLADRSKSIPFQTKYNAEKHEKMAAGLANHYKKLYGKNYNAVYPKCGGAVHSKIAIIFYDGFVRLVITSANLMNADLIEGSNHFAIQDFPLLPPNSPRQSSEFLITLTAHLRKLLCPEKLIESLPLFDFSYTPFSLVLSHPGTHSGAEFNSYGFPRLAKLSKKVLKKSGWNGSVRLEVCTASLGKLDNLWLKQIFHLVTGGRWRYIPRGDAKNKKKKKKVGDDEDEEVSEVEVEGQEFEEDDVMSALPSIRIVYPTNAHVKSLPQNIQAMASNTGASTVNWKKRSNALRSLFHEYLDKDFGRLTHQKTYCLRTTVESDPPLWMMIGSHNFSGGALGVLGLNKAGEPRVKITNIECSVFVEGHKIQELLAPGTTWQDSLTYKEPKKYDETDYPYTSEVWAKNKFW